MAEPWLELMEEIQEVPAPAELRQEILRRRALLDSDSDGAPEEDRAGGRGWVGRAGHLPRAAAVLAVFGGVAAVFLVLVIAAHTRRDASPGPARRVEIVNPKDTRVTTRIIDGSPGLRRAIHDSLAGLGHTTIKTVTVLPASATKFKPAPSNGVVLKFGLSSSGSPTVTYANWQAGLVAAATRDRAIARGLEPVVFYEAEDVGSRLGEARIPPRSGDSPSASELIASARRAAQRLGATIDHITILRPYGLAAAVDVGVRDPGRYISKHNGAFGAIAFPQGLVSDKQPTAIDGSYVQLQAKGRPIAADYVDNRTNTSSRWTDPSYQGCNPLYALYSLPDTPNRPPPPPPCPGVEHAVIMPNVVGQSRRNATRTIRSLGLKIEPSFDGPSLRAHSIPVTEQWPKPGTTIGSNQWAWLFFEATKTAK